MRILVVEDDAILALMASEALDLFGYEVVGPAHTVDEYLDLAVKQPIDLAFIDINLAGKDEGIELARAHTPSQRRCSPWFRRQASMRL